MTSTGGGVCSDSDGVYAPATKASKSKERLPDSTDDSFQAITDDDEEDGPKRKRSKKTKLLFFTAHKLLGILCLVGVWERNQPPPCAYWTSITLELETKVAWMLTACEEVFFSNNKASQEGGRRPRSEEAQGESPGRHSCHKSTVCNNLPWVQNLAKCGTLFVKSASV